jgi:hypothetical protein
LAEELVEGRLESTTAQAFEVQPGEVVLGVAG